MILRFLRLSRLIVACSAISMFFIAAPAYAATGTILPTNPYAWSNNSGWVNWFAATTSPTAVVVTDTALSGYIWSANHGWINLAASTTAPAFVANNGSGTLSGYAWGQNTGWINFSGVTFDSSGVFHGQTQANAIFGIMKMDCTTIGTTTCSVITSWRPPVTTTSSSGGGGGGSNGPPAANYPSVPAYAQASYTSSPTSAPSYPAYTPPPSYLSPSSPPPRRSQAAASGGTTVSTRISTEPTSVYSFTLSGPASAVIGETPAFSVVVTSAGAKRTKSATSEITLYGPSGETIGTKSYTISSTQDSSDPFTIKTAGFTSGTYRLVATTKYPGSDAQTSERYFTIKEEVSAAPPVQPALKPKTSTRTTLAYPFIPESFHIRIEAPFVVDTMSPSTAGESRPFLDLTSTILTGLIASGAIYVVALLIL